ncbi:MAG: pilin [Nanoarchaeota archaeon]|nr:pilin [Nanoarchaeota archaeon]
MKYILGIVLLLLIPFATFADEEISDEDKAKFEEITSPITKIYNLVKYVATAIASLMLLFSGIIFMTSGSDKNKRDNAKDMATYVIIGLIVIWVAPILISYLME